MIKKSIRLICILGLFSNLGYSQYTDIINSNRPGESHSAFSVGKTIFQIESGGSYINESHSKTNADIKGYFIDFDIRYGFWKDELEFIGELQYREDTYQVPDIYSINRSGWSGTNLGFKYLVYDPFKNDTEKYNVYSWKANHKFNWRQFIPAVAVYAGANLNLADSKFLYYKDDKNLSAKGMIALQNHFNKNWVFVTNILVDRIGSDNMIIGGILTATKAFNHNWSAFAEIQAYNSSLHNDILFRTGAAYLIGSNLQLDISIGKNLHKTKDFWHAGIGASWRFDLNYEDILLFKSSENERYMEDSKRNSEKSSEETSSDETPSLEPTPSE